MFSKDLDVKQHCRCENKDETQSPGGVLTLCTSRFGYILGTVVMESFLTDALEHAPPGTVIVVSK
jgi:hypothetical protein